jgi:hypothetical protein
VASLRELQVSFAAALRDRARVCAVLPPANLDVYRNNASFTFRQALERTFPVVHRRVGDDYFRQLAALYRARHPSRSGDLHDFGREFADFLAEHHAGSDYAWLADLARLEWLRTESSVMETATALGVEALGVHAAADLERLEFSCQPSLRLHSSSYPVFSIWSANQRENAPPVDQSAGPEQGMTLLRDNGTEVRALAPRLFIFLSALHGRASLGDAMTSSGFDERELLDALAFAFREGLVTGLSLRAAGS